MNHDFETFTFTYNDGGRHIIYECSDEVEYWPDVVQKFLDFMSAVYGYEIRTKVTINAPNNFAPCSSNEDTST